HPVGQGAFYTEVIEFGNDEKFVMVYDCGSLNYKNLEISIDNFIKTIEEQKPIDILFISHFDKDHVNGIEYLLSKKHVSKIIIPVITNVECLVLKTFYLDQKAKKKTKNFDKVITLLEIASKQSAVYKVGDSVVITIAKKYNKLSEIKVGDIHDMISLTNRIKIKLTGNREGYYFIPFNVEQSKRRKMLKKLLQNEGIDLDSITIKNPMTNEMIKSVNRVYKMLKGGINVNSMCLYAGNNNEKIKNACLYTGDFDAKHNMDFLKNGYGNVWDSISIIQVPHHGSINSHNKELYSAGMRSVISCRENNKHHPHPSVVNDIYNATQFSSLKATENNSIIFIN
ncbi:MAG: MBL fold metallo-hydrolase, partial [Chitinophagaceae bacterium]|nr:MBL fold metallo-hydrolase [Chitinophagaceae bacterium]